MPCPEHISPEARRGFWKGAIGAAVAICAIWWISTAFADSAVEGRVGAIYAAAMAVDVSQDAFDTKDGKTDH